ncbi:MAG: HD-GYP domain-containing protein [Phycisphaerales bacterium]
MDDFAVARVVREIEDKDHSTAAHTWRVVLYTMALAERAGVASAVVERLIRGAALHDIGKLDVPAAILQKPGALTPEEFSIIKTHAALGHARLEAAGETDPLLLALVRNHHERMDGTGYPDGLAGESVPLAARYFAVIDAFDAMTSLRPYRRETGVRAAEHAFEELHSHRDTWYCGEAVMLLHDTYRTGKLHWILEYWNDACLVPAFGTASVVRPRP